MNLLGVFFFSLEMIYFFALAVGRNVSVRAQFVFIEFYCL